MVSATYRDRIIATSGTNNSCDSASHPGSLSSAIVRECAMVARFDKWVDVTADVLGCVKTTAMRATVRSTVRRLTFC